MISAMMDIGGIGAARSVGTEVEVLRSDTMMDRAIVEADSPKIQVLRAAMAERERRRNMILGPRARTPPRRLDESGSAKTARRRSRSTPKRSSLIDDPAADSRSIPRAEAARQRPQDQGRGRQRHRRHRHRRGGPETRSRAQNMANSLTSIYLDQNRHLNSASARKARQFVEAQMTTSSRS